MSTLSPNELKIYELSFQVSAYFREHYGLTKFPASQLMPVLLEIGCFEQTGKQRTPVEEFLDELNERDHIDMLSSAVGEQGPDGLKWSFVFLKGHTLRENIEEMEERNPPFVELQDENYLVDLCDEILEQAGLREHTFALPWSGRNFPCLAYYPSLNLAFFYRKIPQSPVVIQLDTGWAETGLGVHKEREKEKFLVYLREMLSQKDIQLLEIDPSNFRYNKTKQLIQDRPQDSLSLRRLLNRTFMEVRYRGKTEQEAIP